MHGVTATRHLETPGKLCITLLLHTAGRLTRKFMHQVFSFLGNPCSAVNLRALSDRLAVGFFIILHAHSVYVSRSTRFLLSFPVMRRVYIFDLEMIGSACDNETANMDIVIMTPITIVGSKHNNQQLIRRAIIGQPALKRRPA